MIKKLSLVLIVAMVIGLPFLLRDNSSTYEGKADERLIIITPHNEALRHEFALGFKEWYYKKYKKHVEIDWRVPGGTQDVVRYVDSVFSNSFRLHWERDLGQPWSAKIQKAFDSRLDPDLESPKGKMVREAFLASNVGCGIDLFFGGGKVDIDNQARKGQIVPSDVITKHPEWFDESSIPKRFGGNKFWDRRGRWFGTALSGFGVIFNRDVLEMLGIPEGLKDWEDLAKEELFGEVALADPSASGGFTMAFEVILQQQIHKILAKQASEGIEDEESAKEEGWLNGMRLIQKISANSRYFTDAATKPVLDVSGGDCAAGMAIDFYGLFQEENLRRRSGSNRFGFVMPKGGSAISPDPIALFRGAPNPKLANEFIEYVLSIDGQKLWDYKVGTPGGPQRYALSRAPIRKELYEPEHTVNRLNPDLNFYRDAGEFVYHPGWTAPLFKELRFAVKVAFIDPHKELVSAWEAIIEARREGREVDAQAALGVMQSLGPISYREAWGTIKETMKSGNPLMVIRLQAKMSNHFRRLYERAEGIARGVDI